MADAALDAQARGDIALSELYAHASHAMYRAKGDHEKNLGEAIFHLTRQFHLMKSALRTIVDKAEEKVVALDRWPLVLSANVRCVGVLEALNNIEKGLAEAEGDFSQLQDEAVEILWMLKLMRDSGSKTLEVHAGGYAMMDLQQLAVSQGLSTPASNLTSWDDLALTILAEKRSVYTGPGEDGKSPDVLVNAGALALGKEKCDGYSGWSMVTP